MKLETKHSQDYKHSSLRLGNKYHRAAVDGYVDMLCEITKKEANLANEDNGLTPTLLASSNGQLEALRILVGRGGDPEKVGPDGTNALHLAASRNHMNCVSFLVNFGVNMWALDNDLHTAKDKAAINQQKEVLNYLDQMMSKQSALNSKGVQKLKEKAKMATEKRLKQLRKAQMKSIKKLERDERLLVKQSNNRKLLRAAHSISDIKLVGKPQEVGNYWPAMIQPGGGSPLAMGRLISSPSVAKYNSQLSLVTDQFRNKVDFNARRHSKVTKHSDLDSAYSSSVSSTSGYLSSAGGCGSTVSKALEATRRPRYSDLVAVNLCEKATKKACGNSSKQSLKSNSSSIATRLKAFGGVSRKVYLKRMLLLHGANSSSDLVSNSSAATQNNNIVDNVKKSTTTKQHKICSTYKLNPSSDVSNPQEKHKLSNNIINNNNINSENNNDSSVVLKWPPAPSLSRATSEPNFRSALELETFAPNTRIETSEAKFVDSQAVNLKQSNKLSSNKAEKFKTKQSKTTHHEHNNETINQNRHQLLNKCLSQLKTKHQSTSAHLDMKHQEHQLNDYAPTIQDSKAAINKLINSFGCNSDELLRHQLIAGEFPLRPSVIKQRQHQIRATNLSDKSSDKSSDINQQQVNTKSTIGSDSIGSAGSLARRPDLSSSSALFIEEPEQLESGVCNGDQSQGFRCQRLESFLSASGLIDLLGVFERERIDLDALMLLDELDLKSLNILLGPRRKLLKAMENRLKNNIMADLKQSETNCTTDMNFFHVVDTQL